MYRMPQELFSLLDSATREDLEISATLRIFKNNKRFFEKIYSTLLHVVKSRERMLDLGCGYGYLAMMLAKGLGFREVYGVDIDKDRLKIARGEEE